MKTFFARSRMMALLILGLSSGMVVWSLMQDGERWLLVINGSLIGMTFISFTTSKLIEQQAMMINDLMEQVLSLADKNRALAELNRTIVGGLAPETPTSAPPKPSMH